MPDFGFVGPSYEAPSIYQDAQECINFFPEIDPMKPQGERGVIALYPTPGLIQYVQLANAPVRGMRALSGGQILIAVAGANVYSINTSWQATLIGTLSTSIGYVSITDNIMIPGGLTAYIVDGVNRYTWVAATNTFATLPSTDGAFQGATTCDVIDGYVVYNQPNTQNFGNTDLDSRLSTIALYGSKNGAPDPIVALMCDHRQVYLLGEKTTEIWVDVGGTIPNITTFPFQRISGTMIQHGIAAPFSVARFSESIMFVGRDDRGTATIGMLDGYQYVRMSTHAVENSIQEVYVGNAIAFTQQIRGHEMYVVTFPDADLTWVYDFQTKLWHKWLSWENGEFHRHRANCGTFFNGHNIVGDYENGSIYDVDLETYTDNGNTIRRVRRCPHLVSDLQRFYFDELQIQFQPGVGLVNNLNPYAAIAGVAIAGVAIVGSAAVTSGVNPQAMLRWSNDGGSTYSNEHWTSIGQIGAYKNRAMWRRLGYARDRIFEVVVTDPVKAVIVSANLKASVGDN
jgi:hypothetical protein